MSELPNFGRLRELRDTIEQLRAEKKWDRNAFRSVLAEARKAANGFDDAYEFVFFHSKESWLVEEPQKRDLARNLVRRKRLWKPITDSAKGKQPAKAVKKKVKA